MKFTNDEVDALIVILDNEISECPEETLDEYYNKAADFTLAIKQLHFSNEIEHPSVREKVKAVIEKNTEGWINSINNIFKRRADDLSNTAWDNKIELFSDVKRTCKEVSEHLGILIKLEAQEETDRGE